MSTARKVLVLLYALFYAWLVADIERTNIAVGYSWLYVLVSTVAQVLVVIGIVLSTHDDPSRYRGIWKRLFPLLVLELAMEVAVDAVVPEGFNFESHGSVWLVYMLCSLLLAAPAYYFNWKLARD